MIEHPPTSHPILTLLCNSYKVQTVKITRLMAHKKDAVQNSPMTRISTALAARNIVTIFGSGKDANLGAAVKHGIF